MFRLLPLAILSVIALGGVAAGVPAMGETPSPRPSPSESATPTPDVSPSPLLTLSPSPSSPTPAPTLSFASPTPTTDASWSPPSGYGGSLRPGMWVQVTGTDSCLNARVSPGLTTPDGQPMQVFNCLPDGFIGKLAPLWVGSQEPMPVQADGYWWWNILGQGWMAEDWLAFNHDDAMPYPPRPELASSGLIAFSRADGIWLMNADGSDQRPLFSTGSDKSLSAVRWSPDGQMLVFNTARWDQPPGQQQLTQVIELNGAVVAEYFGVTEARFSPDGRYLSVLRVERPGELGGYQARPAIIELATGIETEVGPMTFEYSGPIWAPDSSSVAFSCGSSSYQETLPDGTARDVVIDCGGDGLRVVPVGGGEPRVILPFNESTWFINPSWSPDGRTISIYTGGIGSACRGYTLVDVASATVTDCLSLPDGGFSGGQCGGSAESGATDWSADGSSIAYHWQSPQNENGIAVIDRASGQRRDGPITGAWSMAFAPDSQHLVLGANNYIWVANTDGSGLSLLAEGYSPVWQPTP